MRVRTQRHAVSRAGIIVRMRMCATQRDQPEIGQPVETFRRDPASFTNEHLRVAWEHSGGTCRNLRFVIGPDRDVVTFKQLKARQEPERAGPIVKNGNVHASAPLSMSMPPTRAHTLDAFNDMLAIRQPTHSRRRGIRDAVSLPPASADSEPFRNMANRLGSL